MRAITIILMLLFIGMFNVSIADDVVSTDITDIDAKIAEIQAAPADQRVALMNNLKESIAAMNEADRTVAIEQLQSNMRKQSTQGQLSQMQVRAKEMQLQANEHAMQMQNMNQNRIGDQFMSNTAAMGSTIMTVPTSSMPDGTTHTTNIMSFPNR